MIITSALLYIFRKSFGVFAKTVKKCSALLPGVVGVIAYPCYPVGVITPSHKMGIFYSFDPFPPAP